MRLLSTHPVHLTAEAMGVLRCLAQIFDFFCLCLTDNIPTNSENLTMVSIRLREFLKRICRSTDIGTHWCVWALCTSWKQENFSKIEDGKANKYMIQLCEHSIHQALLHRPIDDCPDPIDVWEELLMSQLGLFIISIPPLRDLACNCEDRPGCVKCLSIPSDYRVIFNPGLGISSSWWMPCLTYKVW